ncbi:hypothetical protein VNI00_006459 [Paramarasmius palmivorus]|uniref:Uncharacterized protein n=1 Tax=Paramarasmius palmivorus TaxID=297713 RepID=A0AAW0D808_9AGAR
MSIFDIRHEFFISRHRQVGARPLSMTQQEDIERDMTMVQRHGENLGRSLLDCPDTDKLVDSVNTHLEFMTAHPRLGYAQAVDGLYWGRGCSKVHTVKIPIWKRWIDGRNMFQNILIENWLLSNKDDDEIRRAELLTVNESRRTGVQYVLFYYRQDHPLMRKDLDLNAFWYHSTNMRQTVYGPLLVFKYRFVFETPASATLDDVPAVEFQIRRFFELILEKEEKSTEDATETASASKKRKRTHGHMVADGFELR